MPYFIELDHEKLLVFQTIQKYTHQIDIPFQISWNRVIYYTHKQCFENLNTFFIVTHTEAIDCFNTRVHLCTIYYVYYLCLMQFDLL